MSEEEQTERKEIGRIKLSDNQDLIASVVESKKFRFIIEDKADNKKVELSIVDKCDEGKWARLLRTAVVYLFVVIFLVFLNLVVAPLFILGVCRLWWLLPTVILGVGFLVQFFDASYLSLRERRRRKQAGGT